MSTYVFDIDETLLHSSNRPLHAHSVPITVNGEQLHIHIRPGAQSLMSQLLQMQDAKLVRVGVWTAATKAYAMKALRVLLGATNRAKLSFVYTRQDCDKITDSKGNTRYVKPLTKFFRPSKRVLLLDDNEDNVVLNKTLGFSVIQVPPFFGSRTDAQLSKIKTAILNTKAVRQSLA